MSGSATAGLTNPLGPGMPMPGGQAHDIPQPRQRGANGTPGAGGTPPPRLGARMPSGLDAATQMLQRGHGQAKAMYQETSKAVAQMDHVRKALERLADKGDVVTPEHVIAEASKLVGHGLDPTMLAGILADMPQEGGGEALGAWVMGHAVAAAQMEQQLMQAQAVARHDMGVSAVHMLTAHDVGRAIGPMGGPEGAMDGGNALGGAGGAPAPAAPMGGSLGLGNMATGPQGPGPGNQGAPA